MILVGYVVFGVAFALVTILTVGTFIINCEKDKNDK